MPLIAATEQPFRNVARQMSKIKDQTQKGLFNFWPGETWSPDVNLYETDAAYLVCVDLAGVEKATIDVVVEDQVLRLKGTRPVPVYDQTENPEHPSRRMRVHLMEIDHGAFSREVELPHDVQRDKIVATHRNGMLWVELPKKAR